MRSNIRGTVMTRRLSNLESYRTGFLDLPLTHTWRGAGSARFLEFGTLASRARRDGSAAEPMGEMTVMMEWSWRVENDATIICGSWSDEELWEPTFASLRGQFLADLATFGNLPE